MFRIEKLFQNDDSFYVLLSKFFKSILLFLTIYTFSILKNNTIFDLLNFKLFKISNYFVYSIYLTFTFFFVCYFLNEKKVFKSNFLSFFKDDLLSLLISNTLIFSIFFILNYNLIINYEFITINILLILILLISKLYLNFFYKNLIDKNYIQKNIMLIGTYDEIKKIINEKLNKIYLIKCCIILDKNKNDKFIKSEFKFPIFDVNEDIRVILEYHSLGQIWILNGEEENKKEIFNKVIKFSVDTLNIELKDKLNLKEDNLIADKYKFTFYEHSKFHGINLFIKLLIDKVFSIVFLIIAFPILLFVSILIVIEDGFPIFFSQNRTGWDGRRFVVYKLRSLYNKKYDPVNQVTQNDDRKLKIGKFIRKYSIDEIPQFYNVLLGDMSIVGPRPHPVSLDLAYAKIYESFLTRYRCNPGVTGWAQVNGLRGATKNPEFMKKRMQHDLWYLKNWSIFLDIYIIFKTFYAIFKFKGD